MKEAVDLWLIIDSSVCEKLVVGWVVLASVWFRDHSQCILRFLESLKGYKMF